MHIGVLLNTPPKHLHVDIHVEKLTIPAFNRSACGEANFMLCYHVKSLKKCHWWTRQIQQLMESININLSRNCLILSFDTERKPDPRTVL